MRVLVVLPTYNEHDNVQKLLPALMASAAQPDVLVVDDSSPDGTADVVRQHAAATPARIHLLSRPDKDGLGAAYRTGFVWAFERDYDVIVQMDADGSHPVERLPALVEALTDADVAIGSRYVSGGGTVNWPLHRRILSRFGNGYARTLLGLPQHDMTGAFRAWRRDALQSITPQECSTRGYGFGIELALLSNLRGLRIVELPITFTNRTAGDSKMSAAIGWEAMVMVWRLRRQAKAGVLTLSDTAKAIGTPGISAPVALIPLQREGADVIRDHQAGEALPDREGSSLASSRAES